jgi:hypothetical protein
MKHSYQLEEILRAIRALDSMNGPENIVEYLRIIDTVFMEVQERRNAALREAMDDPETQRQAIEVLKRWLK